MFIVLTSYNNQSKSKYYNTEYIRSFQKSDHSDATVLELQYGTDLVSERPEEIYEMTKENK